MGLTAGGTGSEELELVMEILIGGLFLDFLLQSLDRAGDVDGLDGAAFPTDEVVAVLSGAEEGEISGSLVEAKAPHQTKVGQLGEQPENGGLVAD